MINYFVTVHRTNSEKTPMLLNFSNRIDYIGDDFIENADELNDIFLDIVLELLGDDISITHVSCNFDKTDYFSGMDIKPENHYIGLLYDSKTGLLDKNSKHITLDKLFTSKENNVTTNIYNKSTYQSSSTYQSPRKKLGRFRNNF